MKLEELKNIWEDYATETPKVNPEEIETLLKGRTQTALQKINRSIRIEGGILLAFIFVFSSLSLINFGFYQKLIAVFLISISLIALFSYIYVSRKLNRILFIHQNLKEAVEKLLMLMEKFSKAYLYVTIMLTPFSFLSGFFYGFFAFGGQEVEVSLTILGLALGFLVLVMCSVYPLTKWLLQKLYGKYIQQLKEVQQELAEQS